MTETQEPVQKSRHSLVLVSALIVVFMAAAAGMYTWYAVVRSCEASAVESASILLVRQRDRYDHTYQFATSASREAIVRPVAELQQILMDTQEVPVPVCMWTAKNELIDYMGTVIRAFQAFGAQEADSTVRDLIHQSEMHYDSFKKELDEVRECAPFCIP